MPTEGITLFKTSGSESNGYMKFFVDTQEYTVLFQGIPSNLQDGRKASYQEEPIAKRLEPLLIYQYTGFREVSFGLSFGVLTPQDAYDLFLVAALFRRSTFPTRRGVPMYCKLNLGPWFFNYKISGRNLERDEYTETREGMNCVVSSYSMTPSEKRLNDEELAKYGSIPGSGDWWTKCPTKVDITVNLYVFLQQVWSTGMDLESKSKGSLATDMNATSHNMPSKEEQTTDDKPSAGSDPASANNIPTPPKKTLQDMNNTNNPPTTSTAESTAVTNTSPPANPVLPNGGGNTSSTTPSSF